MRPKFKPSMSSWQWTDQDLDTLQSLSGLWTQSVLEPSVRSSVPQLKQTVSSTGRRSRAQQHISEFKKGAAVIQISAWLRGCGETFRELCKNECCKHQWSEQCFKEEWAKNPPQWCDRLMKSHRKPSLLKELAFENDQRRYQRCTAEVCADIFTHYCSDNEGESTVLAFQYPQRESDFLLCSGGRSWRCRLGCCRGWSLQWSCVTVT